MSISYYTGYVSNDFMKKKKKFRDVQLTFTTNTSTTHIKIIDDEGNNTTTNTTNTTTTKYYHYNPLSKIKGYYTMV